MAWVHLLGRKFADLLDDRDLLLDWPYWNRSGQQGHCYYVCSRDRRYCISQSKRNGPDSLANIAKIFRDGNAIDKRVGPFYVNKKGQIGLLVAAWNGSQWLQVISPGVPSQPNDEFSEIANKIRADRTIDPQPLFFNSSGGFSMKNPGLRELEDILRQVKERADFDW